MWQNELEKIVNIVSRTTHFLGYSMDDRSFESWQSQEIFCAFFKYEVYVATNIYTVILYWLRADWQL
jgi:hypothetical protein